MRANRLGGFHFRRQQVIDGFIVDFYCHAAALIVEVDGEIHSSQRDQDEERDKILSAHGFRVVRFANEQIVHDLERMLEQILKECQAS